MSGWLYGWKEISNFCGCTKITLKKYVSHHGFPVYRIPGEKPKPVAIQTEVNEWLRRFKKY